MNKRSGTAVFETRRELNNRAFIVITGADPDEVWDYALAAKNAYGAERAPRLSGLEKSFGGLWYCTLVEQPKVN